MSTKGHAILMSSILQSSVWQESNETKLVWITMLALAGDGDFVGASVGGLAKAACVTYEQCQTALDRFMAPDIDSRSEEYQGRRIEKVSRGWRILNQEAFREAAEAEEVKLQAKREEYDKRERDRLRKQNTRRDEVTTAKGVGPYVCPPISRTAADSRGQPRTAADSRGQPRTAADRPSESLNIPSGLTALDQSPFPDSGRSETLSARSQDTVHGTPEPVPVADDVPIVEVPKPGPVLDRHREVLREAWDYGLRQLGQIQALVSPSDRPTWAAMPWGLAHKQLSERLREILAAHPNDYTFAQDRLCHAVDIAKVEAMREGHLRWFTPMRIWSEKNFALASEATIEQARQPRPGSRSPPPKDPKHGRIEPKDPSEYPNGIIEL